MYWTIKIFDFLWGKLLDFLVVLVKHSLSIDRNQFKCSSIMDISMKTTSATFEKSYRRCGNKSWDLIILGREIDISHKRLVFAQRRYIVQRLPKVVKLLKITRWLSMIITIEKNATNIPLKINIPYTNVLTLCRQRSKKNNNFPWRNLHLQSNSYYHDLFLNKLGKDLKLLFDERKIFI